MERLHPGCGTEDVSCVRGLPGGTEMSEAALTPAASWGCWKCPTAATGNRGLPTVTGACGVDTQVGGGIRAGSTTSIVVEAA
ncbi:hypothetical protein NDU88_005110 [Pleurodeles waltl]|uniref:Uncharacterized protein n=1 Tax=Pleurodeles waltl TaxID=8319 RepID=A0AAV7M8B1_PLEWA|nr:hypothetical protein NDU88_005110 [Pleurodeles waltl]